MQVPAGWVVHTDNTQGFAVAIPDSWDFVIRDSATYDADLQTVSQDSADLAAYFKLSFGADTQVRFLGGDPHDLGGGFATNVQVIASDLGPTTTAPGLRELADAKTRLLAKQATLVQPVTRAAAVLAGQPAQRLDYVLTSTGSPAVRSYLATVQRGGRSYEYELTMGALPAAAATTFDTIAQLFTVFAPGGVAATPSPS